MEREKINIEFIIVFFLIFGISNVFGQKDFKVKKEDKKTEVEYIIWKQININNFLISVPKDFNVDKKMGTDLSYWKFKTPDLHFTVFTGSRSPKPSIVEVELPTFEEQSQTINNIQTTIWKYKYESKKFKYPFVWVAYYYINNEILVIYLKSNTENTKELANLIFKSVKFLNKFVNLKSSKRN